MTSSVQADHGSKERYHPDTIFNCVYDICWRMLRHFQKSRQSVTQLTFALALGPRVCRLLCTRTITIKEVNEFISFLSGAKDNNNKNQTTCSKITERLCKLVLRRRLHYEYIHARVCECICAWVLVCETTHSIKSDGKNLRKQEC